MVQQDHPLASESASSNPSAVASWRLDVPDEMDEPASLMDLALRGEIDVSSGSWMTSSFKGTSKQRGSRGLCSSSLNQWVM